VPLDLQSLRGKEILLAYDVRAENVSTPEKDYNGIKCQLHWTSASDGPQWFNEGQLTGTFPWKHSELLVRVVPGASDGVLQAGLQGCSGTAWIANVTIRIVRGMPARPARLRGMVGPASYSPRDLEDLSAWNANCIRWQLANPDWARTDIPADPAIYGPWLGAKLNELDLLLGQAQALGMKVVIDLHAPPGGRFPDGTLRMLMDKPAQDYFIEIWRQIARRFKGHPSLFAYDLMNEPLQLRPSPPGVLDWYALQAATAAAVRAEDPATPIMLEVDPWDSPEGFAWMLPVDVPNVLYSVHMYWPYEYTHQGVDRPWAAAEDRIAYPGAFNSRPFDRAALAAHLAPVREFQKAYGARIFVGEFSVVRWAPGGAQYLSDCITLFEEYGWDWTCHAFREWPGWSLEHADLPYDQKNHPVAKQPPDRARVVRQWFLKN
ncbi:MAG: cellulase family glycosylhydrolase, partial [Chthoniobacteraceae bacterium]|nr:cellulase family glycosylhydrolase [Chthoniobacteraceae bacterium]